MDRPTKTAIKKLVLRLRNLLEEDSEIVLKRYGLFTDRAWLPADKIPKADEAILDTRHRMERPPSLWSRHHGGACIHRSATMPGYWTRWPTATMRWS